ncbi:hypothetical protein C3L33_01035, partial [Rhododendron williamsianum]
MALQWMILTYVVAVEAAIAVLLTIPSPKLVKSRIVSLVSLILQPSMFVVPFSAFQLLDIYWKNEHRLMCTGESCTAAERDRYEKSVSYSGVSHLTDNEAVSESICGSAIDFTLNSFWVIHGGSDGGKAVLLDLDFPHSFADEDNGCWNAHGVLVPQSKAILSMSTNWRKPHLPINKTLGLWHKGPILARCWEIYKAQRNVIMCAASCLLYWCVYRICKYYKEIQSLEEVEKRYKDQ